MLPPRARAYPVLPSCFAPPGVSVKGPPPCLVSLNPSMVSSQEHHNLGFGTVRVSGWSGGSLVFISVVKNRFGDVKYQSHHFPYIAPFTDRNQRGCSGYMVASGRSCGD